MTAAPSKFPDPRADTPTETAPLIRALMRGVQKHFTSETFCETARLQGYFEGTQYDDHEYNWDGSYADMNVGAPTYPAHQVPLAQRIPPINFLIGRTITERLTAMLFGEERFPVAKVRDNPEGEDFLEGVVEAANLRDVMQIARDTAGSGRCVVLSYGWVAGKPRVEIHDPKLVKVLAWDDYNERKPQHVVKIWCSYEPGIDPETGELGDIATWRIREWVGPKKSGPNATAGIERLYRYNDGKADKTNRPRWELSTTPTELLRCPVVVIENTPSIVTGQARADYEGSEGMIDALNITLCATVNGTAINADPTLCIVGAQDPGGVVKKGGFNTIFADAKYLEISGSSVTAGMATVDRMRAFTFESGHVAMIDPEKLTGVQSGEAMRQLLFPTLQHVGRHRRTYGDGYTAILHGLLEDAQELVKRKVKTAAVDDEGNPILDSEGFPQMVDAEPEFVLPPRVVKGGAQTANAKKETVETYEEREPGEGADVYLAWPPAIANTAQDDSLRITMLQQANGGQPLMSTRSSIEAAQPITKIDDVDQELKDIQEGKKADMLLAQEIAPPETTTETGKGAQKNETA